MSKFKYMEYAIKNPSNRKYFNTTKEVISLPFQKENRFTEYWRSMFVFQSNNPKEEDAIFGNFYLECDIEDFKTNKKVMLLASEYLHNNYNIPFTYFDFFLTNKSIWLSLPAKVFSNYGTNKLHIIYKEMATEVHKYLTSKGYNNPLDLSIYKWNGLVHSLGSYLPKVNRWVTKFSYFDLDNSLIKDNIINAKYDNYFTLEDIEPIEKASEWFLSTKLKVLNQSKNSDSLSCNNCERLCMKNLENNRTIDNNRNLHIYSYSLHLKEQGYSLIEATKKVKETFDIDYVNLKESDRTIKSAIKGNKRFNCNVVQNLLDGDLFDCNSCKINKKNKKKVNTFIVPRNFISLLHKEKAHYMTYKYLLNILYTSQLLNEDFTLNLKGDKYKKNTISYFEKLKELEIINFEVSNNIIKTKLIKKERSLYKNHIVLNKNFILSDKFEKLGQEIKVLLELWRSSLVTGKNKGIVFFNVKLNTIINNLTSTLSSITKYLNILKRMKLVIGKYLLVKGTKNEFKEVMKKIILKIRENKKGMEYLVNYIDTVDKKITKVKSMKEYIIKILNRVEELSKYDNSILIT